MLLKGALAGIALLMRRTSWLSISMTVRAFALPVILIRSIPARFIMIASLPPTEQLHTVPVSGEKPEIIMRPPAGMREPVRGPVEKIRAAFSSKGSTQGCCARSLAAMPRPPRNEQERSGSSIVLRTSPAPRSMNSALSAKSRVFSCMVEHM